MARPRYLDRPAQRALELGELLAAGNEVGVAWETVTRYSGAVFGEVVSLSAPAQRMRTMRERRRARGLRELRLVVPDARLKGVKRRVAAEVAGLDRKSEGSALNWIESVSEFDTPDDKGNDASR